MRDTDQADLVRLLVDNDASFGLYKEHHWSRVVRDLLAPWIDARAPMTATVQPPLAVTPEVLELSAKAIVAADLAPADGVQLTDDEFNEAWSNDDIQKPAFRRAAAAVIPYVVWALRAADESAKTAGLQGTSANAVRELLAPLRDLYPHADAWLERRVEEIRNGTALADTVHVGGRLAGIVIGIRKSSTRFKISTLFVAPDFRGRGIGRLLLRSIVSAAAETAGADSEVYITAPHALDAIKPLLHSEGFALVATAEDRYGEGRHENVYARPI